MSIVKFKFENPDNSSSRLHTYPMAHCSLVFWKKGEACRGCDEWTTVDLNLIDKDIAFMSFRNMEGDRILLRDILRLMKASFLKGLDSKARQLQIVLGSSNSTNADIHFNYELDTDEDLF